MKRSTKITIAILLFFFLQAFVTVCSVKLSAKEKVTLEENATVLTAYDTCHSYEQWRESYKPLAPLANVATIGLLRNLWSNHIEFLGYKFKCFDGTGVYYITKLRNKYYCSKSDKAYLLIQKLYMLQDNNAQTEGLIETYVISGKFGKWTQLGYLDENNEFQPNKKYLY